MRYKEAERSYKRFLELKSGNSAAEKELSQFSQAQSALGSTSNLFDSGDFAKALEYIQKAKMLKVRLLIETKDYSSAISEIEYLLKENEDKLEALLLRGRA